MPRLLTCWPVLTEATWLLRRQHAALDRLFGSFDVGLIELPTLDAPAVPWVAGSPRPLRFPGNEN
jgi:hypothetical protein